MTPLRTPPNISNIEKEDTGCLTETGHSFIECRSVSILIERDSWFYSSLEKKKKLQDTSSVKISLRSSFSSTLFHSNKSICTYKFKKYSTDANNYTYNKSYYKDQGGMSRKPLYEEKKVKVLKSKRKNLYNLTLAEFLVSTFN